MIVSFVSAMQIESFRKFEGNPFSTTMCTGNLRSGTEKLYRCLFLREERAGRGAQDYYSVILLFVLGALVGGLCADLLGWTLDPVGLSPPVPRLSADAPRTTVIIKRGVDIFWYPHLFFIQYP